MKLRAILTTLAAALAVSCQAAISINCVWEVRTTGSDQNGGGFITGSSGTDWSQQNSPQYSVTDLVHSSANANFTSATANWGTDVVGNIIMVEGGSFPIGRSYYQVITRNSATSITVDRSPGINGTGCTGRLGGALDHPSRAAMNQVAPVGTLGMDVWIKAGTYNFVAGASNTYGQKINTGGTAANVSYWEGYQTTRGDRGTKPVFLATTLAGGNLVEAGHVVFINVEVDCASLGADAFNCVDHFRTVLCTARRAVNGFNTVVADRCYAVSCTTGFQNNPFAIGCVSQTCTTQGWITPQRIFRCIDIGSGNGFRANASYSTLVNCISYGGSGTAGIRLEGANASCWNCVVMNRTGAGYTGLTVVDAALYNCAAYNNSGAATDNTDSRRLEGFITLTADPFTNAAGGDFSLNAVAGGGALLRATGLPGLLPNGTTTSYTNVGAVENSAAVAAATGGSFTYSN